MKEDICIKCKQSESGEWRFSRCGTDFVDDPSVLVEAMVKVFFGSCLKDNLITNEEYEKYTKDL